MDEAPLPVKVLLEPDELKAIAGDGVLIVDLRKRERYEEGHVPGAVHLDTSNLVCGIKPATGKFPDTDQLGSALSAIGLDRNHHVVGYDGEGNGWAGRLLWTLDMIGHERTSVLNGGIDAWTAAGFPVSFDSTQIRRTKYIANRPAGPLVTRDEILSRLGDPLMALLDVRTPEEYSGDKVRAAKGGHIPGAVNLNWKDTMDESRQRRLLPDPDLRKMLQDRNIETSRQVVVYCHTHHRSAHSYMMLKHLDYPDVKAYDGSWSEWGNDADTPVEF